MKLKDRVAIITGGARGIGKAAVELFNREGAGVVIWDVLDAGEQTASEVSQNGNPVEFMKVDTSDVQLVENSAKAVYDKFGRIDG